MPIDLLSGDKQEEEKGLFVKKKKEKEVVESEMVMPIVEKGGPIKKIEELSWWGSLLRKKSIKKSDLPVEQDEKQKSESQEKQTKIKTKKSEGIEPQETDVLTKPKLGSLPKSGDNLLRAEHAPSQSIAQETISASKTEQDEKPLVQKTNLETEKALKTESMSEPELEAPKLELDDEEKPSKKKSKKDKSLLSLDADKDQEQKSGGLSISLMPKRAIVIPRIVRSRSLLFLAAIIVILTIFTIVWLYTDWYFEKISIEIYQIQGEIQLLEAKTVSFLDLRDDIINLEEKAAQVESILDNHIYWTKFFRLLETYTITDVYFADFAADTSGTIRLDASARDLITLAKQIVAFSQADDFVKYVDITGIRKLPTAIAATFSLELVDDVFHK